MKSRRRFARSAVLAVVAATALVGAGCGREEVVTVAETEGIWVDVGALDYHIQGSRVLEPGLVPDVSYLKGRPTSATDPTGEELWFAVFVRIENKSKTPAMSSPNFEIVDTQGKSFKPYALDPESNPFAYQPSMLEPNGVIPVPDSAQEFDSTAGAELLFKLPLDSYQNRPLELKIHGVEGDEPAEASVNLDV